MPGNEARSVPASQPANSTHFRVDCVNMAPLRRKTARFDIEQHFGKGKGLVVGEDYVRNALAAPACDSECHAG